jgi:hypothetical protein
MANTNLQCKNCRRKYGEHTKACLVEHFNDGRDPACGCDDCHRGTQTPPSQCRSIDLPCWEPVRTTT